MTSKDAIWIRVLLLEEGDFWVAQGLEYDIAVQGRDQEGAKQAFMKTLAAQISLDLGNKREPLSQFGRAPDWYFEAFTHAQEEQRLLRANVLPPAYVLPAIAEHLN